MNYLPQSDGAEVPKFGVFLFQRLVYVGSIKASHGLEHRAMVVISNDRSHIGDLSREEQVKFC